MITHESKSFFADIPSKIPEEIVETILSNSTIRVERIISHGQSSPQDFWYDQDENEWVMVLKGKAKLLFENNDEPILLSEGDYINIPKHVKHRVEWTTPNETTIWLTVFYLSRHGST